MAEREVSEHQDARRPLPRWLVLPVIVLSAGVTAAAMSMTGLRGPAVAWEQANRGIQEVWGGGGDAPPPQTGAGEPSGAVLTAATVPAIPSIVSGAPLVHADRGVCTSCHAVVSAQGGPVPAIYSMSRMPHEYRGVCGNCHVSRIAPSFGAATAVAGTPVAPIPEPRAATVTEAEWLGLEVGPGALGVIVQSAEGMARRLGVQKGDVLSSINALPVRTMADFVSATEDGKLSRGAVIVRRDDRRLAFEFAPTAARAPGGAGPVVLPPPNAQF